MRRDTNEMASCDREMRNPAFVSAFVAALSTVLVATAVAADPAVVSDDGVWEFRDALPLRDAAPMQITPDSFRAVWLDSDALQLLLSHAPHEFTNDAELAPLVMSLPMPDGTFERFRVVESPIMEPELAAKYPEIRTYLGQGLDDPRATVRFDWTPAGFHGQVLAPTGAVYIDPPFAADIANYISYWKEHLSNAGQPWTCDVIADPRAVQNAPFLQDDVDFLRSGETLQTYRLACAATGEYTAFHGGTVPAGLAAIVTAINRVSGIYEVELAVRLVLVANNDLIVYTNGATDPYTNGDGIAMLSQNQSNITSVIGSTNYDIGHVFSTGGGGVASLGVVCVSSSKARGVTGSGSPIGDPFWVDYVAHEMGHQFGAHHTFNGVTGNCSGGNRNASTAYEPGSGATIMAYAGICGSDDLQPNSDPYFQAISYSSIRSFITGGSGSGCDVPTATGNAGPVIDAGPNYTIPRNTPFELTAVASDPDGDPLTICWEEMDLGPAAPVSASDDGQIPLFRSWNPTSGPTRTFPRLTDLLNNTFAIGEQLPSTNRTMDFRVTARDNRAGGGGVQFDTMVITVTSGAGPFQVTAPNTAGTFGGATLVTWNVASTNAAPVSATAVDILLSTDGGFTYPVTLASATANDGSEVVTLPAISTSTARIKVAAADNVFFDISNSNFTIEPVALSILLPDGVPTIAPPATPTTFIVQIEPGNENVAPGSQTLFYRLDGGAFQSSPLTPIGGTKYEATIPSADCSDAPEFYLSAQGDGGTTVLEPATAPASVYDFGVGEVVVVLDDDLETNLGWTVGAAGDTATTGVWTRVDPVGTLAQPEDDHTSDGSLCFVTGQGAVGGGLGDNDVDGGATTLLSPVLDLDGQTNAVIRYWRWYSNDTGASPNADTFTVSVSNDAGGSWVAVETIGPTGPGTGGGWIFNEFVVNDFVAPTNQVQVRFVASDVGSGSIIEAAVDDFSVDYLDCVDVAGPCGDFDNDGDVDTGDFAVFGQCFGGANQPPAASCPGGVDADCDGDGDVDTGDFAIFSQNFTGSQ